MSLAGVQSKLAVALDGDGRICIPMNGSPSTHILKPDSPRLPGGVQNEAFCLTLARHMKIPTPEVTTGRAGKRTYLLVKRYDRTDVSGRWRRLHDAHAKNYSIIIRAGGVSLAPMYDVMCGEVWKNVTKNLAQKIAGKTRGDHIKRTQWQQFARECGLNPKQVVDRVDALAKSAVAEAEAAALAVAAMPAGNHAILDQIRQAVEIRARGVLAQLALEDRLDEVDGPAEPAQKEELFQ